MAKQYTAPRLRPSDATGQLATGIGRLRLCSWPAWLRRSRPVERTGPTASRPVRKNQPAEAREPPYHGGGRRAPI